MGVATIWKRSQFCPHHSQLPLIQLPITLPFTSPARLSVRAASSVTI